MLKIDGMYLCLTLNLILSLFWEWSWVPIKRNDWFWIRDHIKVGMRVQVEVIVRFLYGFLLTLFKLLLDCKWMFNSSNLSPSKNLAVKQCMISVVGFGHYVITKNHYMFYIGQKRSIPLPLPYTVAFCQPKYRSHDVRFFTGVNLQVLVFVLGVNFKFRFLFFFLSCYFLLRQIFWPGLLVDFGLLKEVNIGLFNKHRRNSQQLHDKI